ncbi:DUF2567 domain-containing protein [Micromonospora sp. HUAS LYJ1]|uniref:DUF2567 domain-containing protein n=1 Tax=Micromonospora sp. HUAS LYJ1 TaxID=3061626 RepID=UPI0026726EB0|nr:DUF2567 domain-containing protein [Micromonospora sp. HUAS LYJ1]WKU07538.1 DUF2567 domain-containing protein [Micromonospora sp. HUAS LYJ1]
MSPDTPDPHRPADTPAGAAPTPHAVPTGTPADGPPTEGPPTGPGYAPTVPEPEPTVPGHDPGGSYLPWPPSGWPAQPGEQRPRHTGAVAAGLVLGLTALGVPLGLLWAALAPDTPVLKTAEGAVYAQPQPEQPIAADGWFSLLGLGFGLLAAIAVWTLLRRRRGPVTLVALTVGALGTALVAWQVGRRIGLDGYQRLLATAPAGTSFDKPADLRAGGIDRLFGVLPVPYGNLLLAGFAAAVTYTLLAGWSRWPSLRPEPEPDGPGWPGAPGAVGAPGGVGAPDAVGPAGGVSWGPAGTPAPTAAPEPPAPGAAGPTRG